MNFLLTEDQKNLQATVEAFAQERIAPVAEKLDREGVFPTSLFHELAEIGITSIPFGEDVGGMGLGTFEMVLALEQIARADQSLAVSTMVSVATGLTLGRFGSQAQKDKFLPDIVAGRKICAIAGPSPMPGRIPRVSPRAAESVTAYGRSMARRPISPMPGRTSRPSPWCWW